MTSAIQINHMYGRQRQRLRNVAIHSPSIFWVQSGQKQLFWQESELTLDPSNLLLTRAHQTLTFENKPEQTKFSCLQFSFHLNPPQPMLELSVSLAKNHYSPRYTPAKNLFSSLNILTNLAWQELSSAVQEFWLFGLYQQLAEAGKLHLLFASHTMPFAQQLSDYLTQQPGQNHSIKEVAEHFSISRATFIRRLKKENTQFREVLTQVRMNHALSLMQKGKRHPLDIALRCGYQSQERFSQRFNQEFGLSPKQYLKTLD